ncbi:MAG: efflux transporter periplasmic adaptor subunit [Burkholderiaceae bacterium]|nr:efflux transporter periplasmic adaptor subunit [Burkholderiaceae bacterium]
MKSRYRLALLGAAVAFTSLLAGCGDKSQGGQRPRTEVAIVTIAPERMGITNELPGRLEANRVAQVRARVAGIVLKRMFKEGSEVKEGQVLFQIDPAPYQAALNSAKATLAKAEANLTQASLKLERYEPLVKINAISKQEYDEVVAAHKQAKADVVAGKAAVTTASLNLGYARVTAPISGRIGRALVTEGALVGQGDATPLALIQQDDRMYVNLTQTGAEVAKLRQALKDGKLKAASKNEAQVSLVLDDGSIYQKTGTLLFSDITVDESTGTVTLRAIFPNPDRALMPGTFVRARLQQGVDEQALAVPQQAVLRTNEGSSVMVVGAEDKVESRTVTTASAIGDKWVIASGLKAGDRVIVEGLQKVRVGMPVKPVEWKPGAKAEEKPADAPADKPADNKPAGKAAEKPAEAAASAPAKAAGSASAASQPAKQ